MKYHEGSQVFFKDFKDYSFAPQLFLFFLTGRDLIFNFVLATMFEYPLAQTLIITILNCLMVAYLLIKKPFEETFEFVQQLFFEFVGLFVNVPVFINAIFDAGKYETIQGRKNVGKLIIIANMMFNFVAAIFMLILIGQALIEFYKEYKQKRAKKTMTLGIQHRLQNISNHDTSQSPLQKNKMASSLDQSIPQENFTTMNQNSQNSLELSLSQQQQENFNFNLLQNNHDHQRPQYRMRVRPRNNIHQNRPLNSHNILENTAPPPHRLIKGSHRANYNPIRKASQSSENRERISPNFVYRARQQRE